MFRKLFHKFSITCIALAFNAVHATTFIPLPIEEQIDASDSVVVGTNNGKAYKRLPSGEVVTEYSFNLELASGLPEHQVLSPHSFKIIVPGGKWQNRYYQVHGSASFKEGEQSLLFLKKTPFGWVVNNLSMGKFSIHQDTQDTWFRNSVFPHHPKLGNISKKKMNELLVEKFQKPLKPLEIDKYVHSENEVKGSTAGRSIASVEDSQAQQLAVHESKMGLIWMVVLFGILGFIYRIKAKRMK